MLVFILLDVPPNPSGQAREIPVEVVSEPAPLEKIPAAAGEATQASRSEPRQTPEANPKLANEGMSGPNSTPRPAAPQPFGTDGPRALATPAPKDMARKQLARDFRPAARLAGGPRQEVGGKHLRQVQTGFALPFDTGPDSFRAVAVPLPATTGGEATSYRVIVGGLLERVKHYPETARQRSAKGIATIGFVLDELGRIASVSLLRSSGEADLDRESVALVNRAAPFPPPPPGAQRFLCDRSRLRHGKLSSVFCEHLFDGGPEPLAIDRAVAHEGRGQLVAARPGGEGGGLPMTMGRGPTQTLAACSAFVAARHVGRSPNLVDEDAPRWVQTGLPLAS